MERPAKRAHLTAGFHESSRRPGKRDDGNFHHLPEPPEGQLEEARTVATRKFKSRLEILFKKYAKDFTAVTDEIDIVSQTLAIDNGYVDSLPAAKDGTTWAESSSSGESGDDDEPLLRSLAEVRAEAAVRQFQRLSPSISEVPDSTEERSSQSVPRPPSSISPLRPFASFGSSPGNVTEPLWRVADLPTSAPQPTAIAHQYSPSLAAYAALDNEAAAKFTETMWARQRLSEKPQPEKRSASRVPRRSLHEKQARAALDRLTDKVIDEANATVLRSSPHGRPSRSSIVVDISNGRSGGLRRSCSQGWDKSISASRHVKFARHPFVEKEHSVATHQNIFAFSASSFAVGTPEKPFKQPSDRSITGSPVSCGTAVTNAGYHRSTGKTRKASSISTKSNRSHPRQSRPAVRIAIDPAFDFSEDEQSLTRHHRPIKISRRTAKRPLAGSMCDLRKSAKQSDSAERVQVDEAFVFSDEDSSLPRRRPLRALTQHEGESQSAYVKSITKAPSNMGLTPPLTDHQPANIVSSTTERTKPQRSLLRAQNIVHNKSIEHVAAPAASVSEPIPRTPISIVRRRRYSSFRPTSVMSDDELAQQEDGLSTTPTMGGHQSKSKNDPITPRRPAKAMRGASHALTEPRQRPLAIRPRPSARNSAILPERDKRRHTVDTATLIKLQEAATAEWQGSSTTSARCGQPGYECGALFCSRCDE